MIKEAISELVNRQDLSEETVEAVMQEVMSGNATPAQIGSYLTAFAMKGETIPEITACAKTLQQFMTKFEHDVPVLEIVGTGGDRAKTVNISTMASFVTAACGVNVAKHGNRAASSQCGTADCLEYMGVDLLLDPAKNKEILEKTGFCFLFAQKYHPAMRFVGGVRKEIGFPTIFNCLGPICNPAIPEYQLLGVYKESLVEPLAHVLHNLGVGSGMVVFGLDVLDEISISAPTKVCEFVGDEFSTYEITPEQFGIARGLKSDLVGGDPAHNAAVLKSILKGEKTGPQRDAVVLNAGAAVHIVKGVSIEEGVRQANEAIDSGRAYAKFEQYMEAMEQAKVEA
ncbi:MAG: anthranilate phosphoribosyltransferase [Lachnospiraceae bacterium]|nr:anthranilate phosphoribosyltransferase [Lachnospiraceae bacterium]